MADGNVAAAIAASLKTAEQRNKLSEGMREAAKQALLTPTSNVQSLNPVAEDGNCLFTAIADQLSNNDDLKEYPGLLRLLAMDEIRDSSGGYEFEGLDKEAYIAKYREDSEYGGDNEINALSKVLNRPIKVFNFKDDGTIGIIDTTNNQSGRAPINLFYYGEDFKHYDSVRMKGITYPLAGPLPADAETKSLAEMKEFFSKEPSSSVINVPTPSSFASPAAGRSEEAVLPALVASHFLLSAATAKTAAESLPPVSTQAQPEVPSGQPEVPSTQPEVPSTQPEVPSTQPEVSATQTEVPAAQPEVSATQTEVPSTQPEVPAAQLKPPSARPEVLETQPEPSATRPAAAARIQQTQQTQLPLTTPSPPKPKSSLLGLFKLNVKPTCLGSEVITSDCTAKTLSDHLNTLTEMSANHLIKSDDPDLQNYNKLINSVSTERDPTVKAASQEILKRKYGDHHVQVIYNNDRVKALDVVSPYKAYAYRNNPALNWANPTGLTGEEKDLYDKNIKVIKALANPEIVADKDLSITILESLWFCGKNPDLGNDPRCFPAKVLGEFREYQNFKRQVDQFTHGVDTFKDGGWPELAKIVADVKNIVGTESLGSLDIAILPMISSSVATNETNETNEANEANETVRKEERRPVPSNIKRLIPSTKLGGGVPVLPGRGLGHLVNLSQMGKIPLR